MEKEVLLNSSLNIKFPSLDSKTARNKLREINSKKITLEIIGNKEELLEAINYSEVKTVEFINPA